MTKFVFRSFYRNLLQLGFNPLKVIKTLLRLPRFFAQKARFKRMMGSSDWTLVNYPILFDCDAQSALLGEYFWQDLFVAREIIGRNPSRHIDVGSRVDGFIAHIACVRPVEVFDIRPLSASIENVVFTRWDITHPSPDMNGIADCVSCLHTLEHIGLGRYGDVLNPDGWNHALRSLVGLVSHGGTLWLSVPIGVERIEFNAHRVFDPATIANASAKLGLTLVQFFYLAETGIVESLNVPDDFAALALKDYGLGIFLFRKI